MRRVLALVGLTLLVSACGAVGDGQNPNAPPRPGLEPLYQPPAPARPAAGPAAQPEAPDAEDLPFPPRLVGQAEAEALLAGDPAALRFLTIRRLAETGLIPVADAAARVAANRGALLPLTTAEPPARGLMLPLPPPAEIERMLRALWNQPGAEAQRAFVVDNVLPRAPAQRQALGIADKQSARRALDRLERLAQAGLLSLDQRLAEADALRAAIDGDGLPEILLPPAPPEPVPPPPPPPKKKAGAGVGGGGGAARGQRLPGGVSGELRVIPSPPEINPVPLPAGFTGQAGLHLLSMGSASHAEQAWKSLTASHPELAALTYKVVRADLGELGVTHRLIAGPLSPAKAQEMCATLKPKGQSCQPTPFP